MQVTSEYNSEPIGHYLEAQEDWKRWLLIFMFCAVLHHADKNQLDSHI